MCTLAEWAEFLINDQPADIIHQTLKALDSHLNSQDMQTEIFFDCNELLIKFRTFIPKIITKSLESYLLYEKLLLTNLSHPCLIVSNFVLLLLTDLCKLLPTSRVLEITMYCIEDIKVTEPSLQILRFLAASDDLVLVISNLLRDKRNDLASRLAGVSHNNLQAFEYIKSQLALDSPCEYHYMLARFSGSINILQGFKNFASRVYMTKNPQRRKYEVLALLEYSATKCVSIEIHDLDILKSVMVGLNCTQEYLTGAHDKDILRTIHELMDKITTLNVEEKYKKKFEEVCKRIYEQLKLEGVIIKTQVESRSLKELNGYAKNMCKNRLEVIGPIMEIQMILGIKDAGNIENNYESVLRALENISAHVRKLVSNM